MSQSGFKSHCNSELVATREHVRRWLLVAFCYALIAATAACVKLSRQTTGPANRAPETTGPSAPVATPRLNINTATNAELAQLPGIGPQLAARIIAQRERYGPFRRVEHLLIVPGISERRFAQIRPLVTAN
jgi:competence ComEA-like helix-hairpin-helix protein